MYYRQAGFILTRVYVPAQALEHGVVTLQVHEGILGKVKVEDSTLYSDAMLSHPFDADIGHAVLAHDVERDLLRINGYPGVDLHAIFRPGEHPGETDLVIKPKTQDRVNGALAFDNNGNPLTGLYHAIANIQLNNPLGAADSLSLTVVENFEPKNGTFAALHYDYPLNYGYEHLGFDVSRNRFVLGGDLADFRFKSIAKIGKLYWHHTFFEDREHGLFSDIQFERISAKTTILTGTPYNKDSLSVLGLGLSFYRKSPDHRGQMNLSLFAYHGFNDLLGAMGSEVKNAKVRSSRFGGSGDYAEGQFDKLNLDFGLLRNIFSHQSLLFKLSAQYSGSLLVPLQQFSLGGPNSVRSYASSEYLTDRGLFSSLEWSVAAPGFAERYAYGKYVWGQLLHFSAFVDVGLGAVNDPTPTQVLLKEDVVDLYGYGVGLKFHPNEQIMMKVQVAKPFDFSRESSDRKRGVRYWLNMSYHF